MNDSIDATMVLFIVAALFIFEAFVDLVKILRFGIFIQQRVLLMNKTKVELKSMLIGIKGISKLNKSQLIELLV